MSNWEAIVRDCWSSARVASQAPLEGDASDRRYLRLHLRGPGAPPSAIAMVLPEPTPQAASELPFLNIQRHLAAQGTAVPSIYAARDRDLGVVLMEDLGDRPLAAVLQDPLTPETETRRLLSDAARMVAQWAAPDGPSDRACIAYQRSHDLDLIARELDMVLSHGLAEPDGPARSPASDPEARAALLRLGRALAAQPRQLMHRDFHAWNLHVDARGRLRVIDFQDAMVGPATYDLASLCTDRDSHRFIDAVREQWVLESFAEARAHLGADPYGDPAVLRRDYAIAVAFRTLRVIGRFRFLSIENGKHDYLRYVPAMAKQTRRALDRAGDAELLRLLAERSEYFA